MTEEQIKYMVYRFLGWRLPKPWSPDNGISYQRPNYAHAPAESDWPTGTNLFDADQAEAMARHMIEGMPTDQGAIEKAWYAQSRKNHEEFVDRARAKGRLTTDSEIQRFLVMAAAGEAGELANLYKKEWRGDELNASEFAEKIHGEIADVYIYLMHLCSHLKVDIEILAANKVAVVKNRLNH